MAGNLCHHCQKLDLAKVFDFERREPDFRSAIAKQYISTFQLESISRNNDCQFCQLLLQVVRQDKPIFASADPGTAYFDLVLQSACSIDCDSNPPMQRIVPWLEISRSCIGHNQSPTSEILAHSLHIQRLVSADSGSLGDATCFGWGRAIRKKVDVNLLKGWISLCSSDHSGCAPVTLPAGTPDLVIDVKRRCIVQAPGACHYAALSYVWGDASKQLKLLHKTKGRLMSPNGLGDAWPDVPKTIRHAIQLCQELDVPFLWVDALCINQDTIISDNIGSNERFSRKMHQIYRGAFFTIVGAAGTNCWADLPAFAGERASDQCKTNINGLLLANLSQNFPHEAVASKWNKRAWTLQERVMSKRLMIFTEDRVFWVCACSFREDIYLEHQPQERMMSPLFEAFSLDMMIFDQTDDEGFGGYLYLAQDFSSRQLSFQSDPLAAFDGVLPYVGEKLETACFWGIPISYFELALLFNLGYYDPNNRRREFPSWTWLGWNQEIQSGKLGLSFKQWASSI